VAATSITADGLGPDAGKLRLARFAVSAMFFINGFTVGHWATKIPVLVERLDITEAVLGRLIILFGIGAVAALIAGAWAVTRYGSPIVLRWTSLLLIPSLPLLTLAPDLLWTAVAMLWLGMFLGAMDNAMNANGVAVEVELNKPVMSSYHGFWSLGGMVGGLTGGAMIVWLGEMGHALTVAAITAAVTFWTWRHFWKGSVDDAAGRTATQNAPRQAGIPRVTGIYVLGVVTMLCFAAEGTIIDWSALYLRDELEAPLLISGYAFAAFSATMAAMRFLGDGLRGRVGDRPLFVGCGVLTAIGLAIAGAANGIAIVCLGFFVAGVGMANLVPVLFSTAGRYRGLQPSIAIAVITTFGYAGLLFIPAFVGFIAENFSLAAVFAGWGVIVAVLGLCGFVLPGVSSRSSGSANSASARKS